jgi:antitoxin HicB
MLYPATLEKAPEGGYVVTFRDIPEAITQGDDLNEALDMAADALLTAMEFYFEDGRKVPLPSKRQKDEHPIALPVSVWAKILLLNEFIDSKVSAAVVSRKMGMSPQNFNRVLDINHATKIDTINDAMRVLGKQLTLHVA